MDLSRLIVDHLNASGIGATVYHDVPRDRPASFAVVTQTGGSTEERCGWTAYADIDLWARTRRDAAALAERAASALLAMPDGVGNVFDVSITSFYDNPDLESRPPAPRYTVGVEVTAIA